MFQRVPFPDEFIPNSINSAHFATTLKAYLRTLANQINTQIQDVGPELASASVVSPSNAIHVVTGDAVIDTINAPLGFSGFVRFVVAGGWTISAAGNVALAVTPTLGGLVLLDYVPTTAKWYPLS